MITSMDRLTYVFAQEKLKINDEQKMMKMNESYFQNIDGEISLSQNFFDDLAQTNEFFTSNNIDVYEEKQTTYCPAMHSRIANNNAISVFEKYLLSDFEKYFLSFYNSSSTDK